MKHTLEFTEKGGLAYCTTCKGGEGSLTTDCCGRPITEAEDEAIYDLGTLDFINGKWINPMSKEKKMKMNKNEKLTLMWQGMAILLGVVAVGIMFNCAIRHTLKHPAEAEKDPIAIYTIHDVYDAIEQEESGGDPTAVCPDGCCVGLFQITKIYVDEYNRIQKLLGLEHRATYEDRLNPMASGIMTATVTIFYANRDWFGTDYHYMDYFETVARTHKNPTLRNHESTKPYWEKIKARMQDARGSN